MNWFESEETKKDIHHISISLHQLVELVERFFFPHSLLLSQKGGQMGQINGVPVGGQGSFAVSLLPVGSALPAGQALAVVYTADDPAVVLTPSADGSSVVAAVPASDTNASFNLTATGTAPALSAPITSGPVKVPILPVVPPPPPLPTALDLTQTA